MNYKELSATVLHFPLLDPPFLTLWSFFFHYMLYAKKRGIFFGKNMTKAHKNILE